MSKIRQRTKHLLLAGLVGVVVTGAASTGIIAFNSIQHKKEQIELRKTYQAQVDKMEAEMRAEQAKKVMIYQLKRNLKAGDKIRKDDLLQKEISMEDAPEDSITDIKQIVSKIIKIPAAKNTTIIPSILYSEGVTPNDLRYQEFNVMKLPSDLTQDQFVDVRINFPTGQDYIVLSKKKVKKLAGASGTVWYEMNESEILTISSAIVDAFINGGKIYALSYVDPEFQDKAQTTYPVNSEVMQLMQNDPNILAVAKMGLNRQMREQLERDLKKVDEVDKMKYTTGDLSYEVNNNNAQVSAEDGGYGTMNGTNISESNSSNNAKSTPDATPVTENKADIVQPATDNTIPTDKQDDIFQQNTDSVNP
ncbi:SAF domain-containing protein [Paenibacillus sp. LS1]|uniref:SAF domain-containing protein n=1 Tax=Paenibacillus sp. LS1 TaxID=2992120 RepID=UPI0022329ED8|nr:SAF domain-containing protein [Paenibacillus sp. LS1]MCW3793943.1 SAF domain-containing protein [Paenibacillus sp. LS1]